jgi:hypothetical protein
MADRSFLEKLSRKLTEEGKLIEAGWVGLRLVAIPVDAPAIQLEEMKMAFFAGAHHLFSSIMMVMDPDEEPTEADMERLDLINNELDKFIKDFELKHTKTKGNA